MHGSRASVHYQCIPSGDTGLVGTAAYISPELLKPAAVKYSQKVDIYSLGLIFFEMCHPPPATAMERHKILSQVRQKDVTFPESFEEERRKKQVCTLVFVWGALVA